MNGPGRDNNQPEAAILALIDRSQEIMCQFVDLLYNEPDKAWEAIVELNNVLQAMREYCPAQPFVPAESRWIITQDKMLPQYQIARLRK